MSVVDIAFHRSTAVTVGVVWAGFVSRFWWPSEARRELGKQLGEYEWRMFLGFFDLDDLMRPS